MDYWSRSAVLAATACTPATRSSSSASSRRSSTRASRRPTPHRLLAERAAAGSVSFGAREAAGTRLLILLAERDPYAAELSEYFLRTEGYEVAAALDAAEAARRFEELTPSMTVIDLLISPGSGLELCRQLKQRSGAPVLAISTLEASDQALRPGPMGSCRSRWTHSSLSPPSRICSATAPSCTPARPGPDDRAPRQHRTGGQRQSAAGRHPGRRLPAHGINLVVGPPGAARRSWPSSTCSTTPPPSGRPST